MKKPAVKSITSHIFVYFLLCSFTVSLKTNYDKILSNLNLQRKEISDQPLNQATIEKCTKLLYKNLTDSVFPAWYGTPWDFNGTSNIPGEGKIACGYFVSTTLKHVGFNLNRYKLAQQASSIIVKEVCGKNMMNRFHSQQSIFDHLKDKKNGLFIVGLDFHVGFLAVENSEVYFVHSDYINDKVVKELAEESAAFQSSEAYVLGEITNNSVLIKEWLNGEKIY